jgi:hypothetical protein
MNPMMPLVDRGCGRSSSAWAQVCPNLVNRVEAMLRGIASDLDAPSSASVTAYLKASLIFSPACLRLPVT